MSGTSNRFYVTTPIYYVNDKPHLGHAYTTTAADALARWHRSRGRPVTFLTGTDEHGDKVFRAATARGMTPQQHTDDLVTSWKAMWARLDITYDDFVRTTEPRHVAVVQSVLQRLYDAGDIYAADYEGWYSTAAERFWTEKDLVDGKCPDTGQPVEWISEKNWFFRMGKYADALRGWIASHPDFLKPEHRRNEVLGYLRKDVGDLCISRPRARLPWGITIPFDPDYVTYVWFDALLNYASAVGYVADPAKFADHWPADVHLMGKDILTTHAVYWSTMLFALGLEPARCIFAHGWWTIEGQKMSKSIGNVVDPHLLVDAYGADAVRYFLLREIPFGGDGDFSHTGFMTRYNADLANDLGNLAHRALSMTDKWLGGRVPALDAPTEADAALEVLTARTFQRYCELVDGYLLHSALEALFELVRAGNKYIDTMEPWRLNREGQIARLGGVLRRTLELCRVAAALLAPVCPNKARELGEKLGLTALDPAHAGHLAGLVEGAALRVGDPLFPRLMELPETIRAALERAAIHVAETPTPARKVAAAAKAAKTPSGAPMSSPTAQAAPTAPAEAAPALIGIEDFQKVQLRTGRVLEAAKHPSADRLLVLKVDLGEASPRTICAGIASRYAPEELVGLNVVVVANLKPVKLRGIESQGMLLAAGGGDVKAMATLTELVEPGTIVR